MISTEEARPHHPVDVRLKLAAGWTATMLIVVFVDLFSLYRPDVRADIEAGKLSAFDIGQPFLLIVTLYVVIPVVMIYLSLVLPRRVCRTATIVVAGAYAVTFVGGAIGEWNYYVFGTLVELALLAAVIRHAWMWPAPTGQRSVSSGTQRLA